MEWDLQQEIRAFARRPLCSYTSLKNELRTQCFHQRLLNPIEGYELHHEALQVA